MGFLKEKREFIAYPIDIKWCKIPKERLENLLKSRIQPWEEEIKIRRIISKKNEQDGIFVIEIPRGKNPPHMFNHSYYQRLNFQTQPMSHQNVLRAFQTSWTRRRDLHLNILEPIYSEIKMNCEKIEKYEISEDEEYQRIILGGRYLYDLIEPSLQKKIDEFYRGMDKLNLKLSYWAHVIAAKIINEELSRVLRDHREWIENHMDRNILLVSVTLKDPSGGISTRDNNTINGALLQRTSIKSYLQSQHRDMEVVEFEPYVQKQTKQKISKSDFNDLWKSCKSKAAKNKTYLSIWNEIPKLLTLGREILELILSK